MKFSGIDLHSNNSVVVISDGEDRLALQRRLPNELGAILTALPAGRSDPLVRLYGSLRQENLDGAAPTPLKLAILLKEEV